MPEDHDVFCWSYAWVLCFYCNPPRHAVYKRNRVKLLQGPNRKKYICMPRSVVQKKQQRYCARAPGAGGGSPLEHQKKCWIISVVRLVLHFCPLFLKCQLIVWVVHSCTADIADVWAATYYEITGQNSRGVDFKIQTLISLNSIHPTNCELCSDLKTHAKYWMLL